MLQQAKSMKFEKRNIQISMKGQGIPIDEQWGSKFFRTFVIFLNLTLITYTLTMIGMIIYVYAHMDHIWNGLGSFGLVSLILLQLTVILLILTSLLGIQGARTRNSTCMSYHVLFMFIWFLVFLALGLVTSIVAPKLFDKHDASKCMKTQSFRKFQSWAEQAEKSICKSCACYFPNSDNPKEYSTADIVRMETVDAPLLSRTDKALPVRVQDCPGWGTTELSKGFEAFQELEKVFSCTGWCANTTSSFYRFTDVNRGPPSQICYTRFSAQILHLATIQSILVYVFSGLCLVAFVSGLMFMCGRRVYRPLGDQNSTNQLSSIGGTMNASGLGAQNTQATQNTPTPFVKSQSRNLYTVK